MCGIVGYIGTRAASGILIDGLRKLEYRGYDSAGVATISEGELHRVRAKGKLKNLQDKLDGLEDPARLGIGHTRWATHGKPEEHNAHPHTDGSGRIAVVQNGIVENYRELREGLMAKGYEFKSETDTEVIPHLIADYLAKGVEGPLVHESTLLEAVRQVVNDLDGAFALAIISADFPDELIVVRQQAPLAIGFGQGEFFCASDTPAIVPHTRAVLPLDNGELAMLTPLGAAIYDFTGRRLKKHPITLSISPTMVEKQGFKHFMLKEIHEQPGVVRTSLETYLASDWTPDSEGSPINLGLDSKLLDNLNHVQILACGTSWHASLVGKHLLEHLAGIPTVVHYASEFRYSPTPLIANALTIGVTQSGETADTLAALDMEQTRRTQKQEQQGGDAFTPRMLGITNRPESSLGRMIPNVLATHAGIEIGVAATKTFVAQLMAFYFLALELAYQRKTLSKQQLADIIDGMRQLPNHMEQVIEQQEGYTEELAHSFTETQDFIFIGRGVNYPIALEGALKLKEISYIHAEGYPAGEMKHGPIALLDAKVPVVAIAVPGSVYDKVLSNAQEAKARDAQLIGVAPANDPEAEHTFDTLLPVPTVDELLSPMLTVLPLQLLSYHIAARRGLDVDQPRNLAKSVTVE